MSGERSDSASWRLPFEELLDRGARLGTARRPMRLVTRRGSLHHGSGRRDGFPVVAVRQFACARQKGTICSRQDFGINEQRLDLSADVAIRAPSEVPFNRHKPTMQPTVRR